MSKTRQRSGGAERVRLFALTLSSQSVSWNLLKEAKMTDINSVVVVGRLTRDAELKYTSGGTAIGKFSIAVNRSKKTDSGWTDEASFFDVVHFGKSAEAVNQYLTKGQQVALQGELVQNRWKNDKGENRSKVEINARTVQLIGKSQSQGGGEQVRSGSDNFEDDVPI
jgi:single-strand DNA-binding protein